MGHPDPMGRPDEGLLMRKEMKKAEDTIKDLDEWAELSKGIDYTTVGIRPVKFTELTGPLDEIIARLQGWQKEAEADGLYDVEMKVECNVQDNGVFVSCDLSGKRKMMVK